ncbi:hypothetical protein [Roseitranquillus sediminis]|uniref:hypothetical protein n=1 Tax=Roseitranquillus sediminis TaxID=2809051 RepID=UPI001D0C9961|nr:hypothetical protein [Roseitranquillus sediminis]MBM9595407.1 hypothetical protein [Roseitranquillus sediminis]
MRLARADTATVRPRHPLVGAALVATMLAVTLFEWTGRQGFALISAGLLIVALSLLSVRVRWVHRAFLAVGMILAVLAVATLPDWPDTLHRAFGSAGFIVAYFVALLSLRVAASGSGAIAECGRFMGEQPPGRRYLALTVGGQLFGLVIIYGAISLLGTMVQTSVMREPDPRIRSIRLRRMLLAIQRGLVSILPWSPVAFTLAVTIPLVPGATWAGVVLPCFVTGMVIMLVGWFVDTLFERRPGARQGGVGAAAPGWRDWAEKVAPLLMLLAGLGVVSACLMAVSDVRFQGIVMVTVPSIALCWVAGQIIVESGRLDPDSLGRRCMSFIETDLPEARGEVVLLAMAGFIGTLGSGLLGPVVAEAGLDLSAVPPALLLICVFLVVPVTGQIGMNPILAVSLIAPLLPSPDAMGISPVAVVVAITAGWALSGATSPYTASTLLVAYFGKVSATRVGLQWNGLFVAFSMIALGAWILTVTHFWT